MEERGGIRILVRVFKREGEEERDDKKRLGMSSNVDYLRIFASESVSNPDTDIIFLHLSIYVSVSVSEG